MEIKELLEQVRQGGLSIDEAEQRLRNLPFEDIGFAKLDHHRETRNGFGETVFCQGKTPEQCAEIFAHFAKAGANTLGTRADMAHYEAVRQRVPEALYQKEARAILYTARAKETAGCVAVCTAGTSDIPVAEEAAVTAEFFGSRVERVYDVGVAGIHRLFARLDTIRRANAVVACAGMEGALASVIGGLVSVPVIALPTSVGYGSSFGGLSALLTMLNSCAEGVATVNIDNGFGAGYLAAQINRQTIGAAPRSGQEEIK